MIVIARESGSVSESVMVIVIVTVSADLIENTRSAAFCDPPRRIPLFTGDDHSLPGHASNGSSTTIVGVLHSS